MVYTRGLEEPCSLVLLVCKLITEKHFILVGCEVSAPEELVETLVSCLVVHIHEFFKAGCKSDVV